MSTPIRQKSLPRHDASKALAAWLRLVPREIQRELLLPAEITGVLERVRHFLQNGDAAQLEEVHAEVHRLAMRLQHRVGQAATVRCLRDGMRMGLLSMPEASEDPELIARVLCRASDAVWEAQVEALQEALLTRFPEPSRQELMLAKRIQERLLPRTVPEIPGYDVAGKVLPAADVGGDYWSARSYPEDDIVAFKLADVTGHGIAAATLVAAVKFISGGYYRASKTAAQVMERTNHVLVRDTPAEILIPMVYGWLYPHSHEMSVVNAGHSPVLHLHGGVIRRVAPTGVALGMLETRYREVRLALDPGDVFLTCSDGVTAPAADGALGEEWVEDQLARHAHLGAMQLVEHILAEALSVYGAPLDDMSLLVIKRHV